MAAESAKPLAPRPAHLPKPRGKRCIMLYMAGGPSQIGGELIPELLG
jgi:hypothetical protein